MTWTGSISDDWINKETGERIEFRKSNGLYTVWLMGEVNGRKRGSKLGETESKSEAKKVALTKIDQIGNERWFSRYE